MTPSAILQDLAQQVRRDTVEILRAAEPEWLTFAPPGTTNHMLWHAGHALWVQDLLCVQLLTESSKLPPGWDQTFGMNCTPPSQTENWPDRDELIAMLGRQLERILALLAAASAERLASVAKPERGPATVSERIVHGFHDEAKHCGEMYLLLKCCRAGA